MAAQVYHHNKRKSCETNDRNDGNRKKVKSDQNINNSRIETPPGTSEETAVDGDGTQEYELEDSDGFDFVESEEILQENTQDFLNGEGSIQTPIITRDSVYKNERENEMEVDKSSEGKDIQRMVKIESVQRDAKVIKDFVPEVDIDKIYHKVLEKRGHINRVEIVTNEILENVEEKTPDDVTMSGSDISEDGIFNEVAEILIKYPKADPSVVYDLLMKYKDKSDRLQLVINQMSSVVHSSSSSSDDSSLKNSSVSVIGSDKSTDLLSDPSFKSNPLYKDLKTLKKVLPEKDPNELYAFLEAHFDKANRVQIVIDELTKSESQESLPVVRQESVEDFDRGKEPVTTEDRLQRNLIELKEIFPDCDPNYLYEKLNELSNDPDRVGKVAMELFENKNYPKLKDVLENEKKTGNKEKLHQMKYKQSDFLVRFPDPVTYFSDTNRQVNENYKAHVLAYVKNTYPYMKDGYIKKVLQNHNYHLAPSVMEMEKEIQILGDRTSKKKRVKPREEILDYPDDPEELFFHEVLYCQHHDQIKAYLKEKRQEKQLKVEAARDKGELMECACCYDDECLFEDMEACADGHLFCRECIRRSSEAAVGDGKTKFLCLTGTCEHQFPLKSLQEVLPANLFSLALRKMQEEELRQADIPDLVTCPFCSFATIMPDPDDKVFKCLNPDCLRDSCRLCKEPNHIPLHCDEIEKQGETNMRAYIETKMSEAMLRTCPSCKKRFYKESGCNKMTCTCGASMCYVCREPNIDYDHFDENKCPIDSNIFTLHKEEMLEAAELARQEYLKDHPQEDRQLKYDPVKLLEKMKKRWDGGTGEDNDDDAYDDYDEDDGDYDDYY